MTTAQHVHETIQKDPRLVAGRYRLHARIGHGRLGEIFRADDEMYDELGVSGQVAIQLLPERVTLERKLFGNLKSGYSQLSTSNHPNIVPFLNFDHDGKFGYLVMDLLQGASLHSLLDDAAALPLDEVIPVICAVGDALQFLHAKSMAHSKLTTDNVFVTENLEVRLLDVIPLNSDSGILRGLSANDPFRSRPIEGDIYGLACLTYQILAGKHPFNFRSPAEACLARLEPARIDSLPERQWNAIRRGLSFEDEQSILSVEDFFREFGINGTERLQTSSHVITNSVPPSKVAGDDPTLTVPSDSPDEASVHAVPTDLASPAPQHEEELVATPGGERIRWMPPAVLSMTLVGLGVWWLYGQPRDNVVAVMDYVGSYLDSELPVAATISPAEDNSGPVTADRILVTEQTVGGETSFPTTSPAAADNETDTGAIPEPATLTADEQPGDQQRGVSGTEESLGDDGIVAGALASTAEVADPSGSEPEFTLAQSLVSVSERDGGARITAHRAVDSTAPVVWWTSDHTAVADEDYIPIQEPVPGFTSGEETETLYIPLVNDSLVESKETFYVYLGKQNTQLGRLEPILRVQVDINDDE